MQLPSCKKKKKSGLEESSPSPAYSLHQPLGYNPRKDRTPALDLHGLISLKAQYRGDYSLQRCVHSYYVNLGFLSAVLPKNNWKHLHSKNSIRFAFLPTPRRGSGANPFTLHWKETWGLESLLHGSIPLQGKELWRVPTFYFQSAGGQRFDCFSNLYSFLLSHRNISGLGNSFQSPLIPYPPVQRK